MYKYNPHISLQCNFCNSKIWHFRFVIVTYMLLNTTYSNLSLSLCRCSAVLLLKNPRLSTDKLISHCKAESLVYPVSYLRDPVKHTEWRSTTSDVFGPLSAYRTTETGYFGQVKFYSWRESSLGNRPHLIRSGLTSRHGLSGNDTEV